MFKLIRLLIFCAVLMLYLTNFSWAGSIEGDNFVIRPYLDLSIYQASSSPVRPRVRTAAVPLYFQIENFSSSEVTIAGMNLEWGIYSNNYNAYGTIRLEQTGAPPFNQIMVWAHGSITHPIADVTTSPVVVRVPPGRYYYNISLRDPDNYDAVVLSSGITFVVK